MWVFKHLQLVADVVGKFCGTMGHTTKRKIFGFGFLIVLVVGLIIPENVENPVAKADKNSYNSKSFWFYPWGKSGTHKGVDIFAREGD